MAKFLPGQSEDYYEVSSESHFSRGSLEQNQGTEIEM